MENLSRLPIKEVLEKIRFLDSSYFVGLFNIEENNGFRDIRRAEKLTYPFVQNVKCLIPNPRNRLDSTQIENGINYYIRYNPRNRANWL